MDSGFSGHSYIDFITTEEVIFMKRTLALLIALLLTLSAAPALASQSVIAFEKATIYSDKALNTPVGQLPKYAIVKATKITDDYFQLKVKGKTCYAAVTYLGDPAYATGFYSNGKTKVKTVRACRAYNYPSTSATSTKVKSGRTLYCIGIKGKWALVMTGNEKYAAYIKVENLVQA